jgi:hypothetical protein
LLAAWRDGVTRRGGGGGRLKLETGKLKAETGERGGRGGEGNDE